MTERLPLRMSQQHPAVGKQVKLSASFLRSIGNIDPNAESVGTIEQVEDGWLAHVRFGSSAPARRRRKPASTLRKINLNNLVLLDDVAAEAREAERRLPGITIGYKRAAIFGGGTDPHLEHKYLIKDRVK